MERTQGFYEALRNAREGVPRGTFYGGIELDFRNYKICAYPGPSVVLVGRAEHLPLHIHAINPRESLGLI